MNITRRSVLGAAAGAVITPVVASPATALRSAVPDSSGGYVNYLEAGTSMQRYLAGNYSQWRTVRSTYDPRGVIAAPIAV